MLTRDVSSADAPRLQDLMREAPQKSSGVEFSFVTEPDFFGRARAYDHARVLVAEDQGALAGSAAVAIRTQVVDNVPARVGYEFQYFTAPAHRRKGVASHLREAVESLLTEASVDYSTALIADENMASISMFERSGFVRLRELSLTFLMVLDDCPCVEDPRVRTATSQDLPAIARLINTTWQGHDLRIPLTPDLLAGAIARVPTLDFDRMLVREEGEEITAAAGIWDWSKVQSMYVHQVSPEVQSVIPTLRPNSIVHNWGLTHIGYQSPDSFNALLRYVCGLARRHNVDQIALVTEKDAGIGVQSSGIATATLDGGLYVKSLTGRPPTGNAPVFVDVIDL